MGRRAHHRATFAVLAVGVLAFGILQSLVLPVLATLQVELHTSQNTVTWVLTAYLLSASIFTPIMGRIGDIVGKERAFVATLLALAAGSVLAALAPNIQVLIVARAIQGIGGGVLPLAFGIIRDEFPAPKVSSAVGAIASLGAVGTGVGVVVAGPIVTLLDYHWLFWLPLILTSGAAVAAHHLLPESPIRSPGRISWLPAVLLSGWLIALLLALSQASAWGWGSVKVIVLFLAAVVLAGLWVETERRVATPLIDLRMMRLPAVWTSNLVALLLGVGLYAVLAFLPEFVQTPTGSGYGFGAGINESGLILLPSTVATVIGGLIAGWLARAIGGKAVVVTGCLIGSASMVMLALAHDAKWQLYVAGAIQGAGLGIAYAAVASLVVRGVPPAQTGVASGMNANFRTIGGSIGAALMASILTANPGPGRHPKEIGYTMGFAVLAVALGLAALTALLIPAFDRSGTTRDR
jgi:MFS family permease